MTTLTINNLEQFDTMLKNYFENYSAHEVTLDRQAIYPSSDIKTYMDGNNTRHLLKAINTNIVVIEDLISTMVHGKDPESSHDKYVALRDMKDFMYDILF